MTKKLGIVTFSAAVGRSYKENLEKVFGDDVDIFDFSFENNNFDSQNIINQIKNLDTILISTYSQYEMLRNYLTDDFNVVIAKLTLSKKGYNILKSLTDVDTAMLVNLSPEMAAETIGLLYQLGFDYIKFIPVYPNMGKIPNIDVAVTTGEMRFVPQRAKRVYDLGHRLIDESTIVELFINLGLEEYLANKSVSEYFDTLVTYNIGVEYLLGKSNALKNQLDALLSLMDKGVIYANKDNIIVSCNGNAENIVRINKIDMLGKAANKILPEIDFSDKQIKDKLVKINGKYISLSCYPILEKDGKYNGSYAIIEDFQSKEDAQNKLRLQLMNKGHVAKYTIDQILGNSSEIEEVRNLIKRMAKSKASVLITGESGTGKELVAQAIHNLSNNKDKHFVAVNCASFNPSLLESELFGYEAGAFTGASKSGKKGIFEMANNGTLFLDEIGEMPIELQAKLLRVIEEREIMRVGGSEVIKVDMRIIAATNLDLEEQIQKGLFRKDLYYRLNVLPIYVPPLRDRKEDIEVLIEYFKNSMHGNFVITKETMNALKEYNWDGNIRELINCVRYLDNLEKSKIEIDDLPHHIRRRISNEVRRDLKFDQLDEILEDEKCLVVLEILHEAFLNREKLGRKTISQKAYNKRFNLSEYDVKSVLKKLSYYELTNSSRGRGGSVISPKGIEFLEALKKLNAN